MDKLRRDIQREMKKYDVTGLPDQEKQFIGEDMIDLMKDQIAAGISPIYGKGRFPGYKWADRKTRALKAATTAGRSDKAKGKRLRALANQQVSSKYPYNMMRKFPGKKVRPVNLNLSGNFLDHLRARATKSGVEIGFYTKKYELYEQGHREGANTQPKRPIIPVDNETFSRNVYQRLVDSLRKRLLKYFG